MHYIPSFTEVQRECPLAAALAAKLRASNQELVRHWLDRIADRVSLEKQHLFPSADLLDHVPLLIDGIAAYLENPADEVSADAPVVGKAMELGALRHSQGFDAYEILKEYEILGGILFNHLADAADAMPEPCAKSDLLICGHRVFRAIAIIQNTTTSHYLRLAEAKVSEREDRLRAFNRAISHEIKNHIGAILGAGELLGTLDMQPDARKQLEGIVVRNARAMKETVENLVALARTDSDPRQHRNVRLAEAIREACRQVRESAQDNRVEIRISPDLPDAEVNAPVVELSLTNYLSNAIKYSNPQQARTVDVSAAIEMDGESRELVIRVRDNGLGVPIEKRSHLFERFFRAHETVTRAPGTGLGLSIVRDTVETIGGRAWAEFPEIGAVFAIGLPYRRDAADRRNSDDTVSSRPPAATG
jgi:nitrogen-specific signal transduction histidine kinase